MGSAEGRRLCILADSLVVGGAERVVQALAEDLPGEGFSVRIGCLRESGPIGDELARAGVPVETGIAPSPRDPLGAVRIGRWLDSSGAEIAYLLDHSNVLWHGRLAAAFRKIPQVCAIHRTRRADGTPSLGFADRMLTRLSGAIIAVSRGHAAYLESEEGIPAARLRVVYNGVDPDRFTGAAEGVRGRFGLPEGAFLWAIVAALRPEKNHETALRILQRVDGVHLVLVGSGPREGALRELAARLDVEDRVHWLGLVDDVATLLPAVDLVGLTSHPAVETFPLSLLEAMAASRPVLATRVGSLDEMVNDGETGYLVAAGDEDAFAGRLLELRDDADLRRRLGEGGRNRVARHFTRERMVKATAAVLAEQVAP